MTSHHLFPEPPKNPVARDPLFSWSKVSSKPWDCVWLSTPAIRPVYLHQIGNWNNALVTVIAQNDAAVMFQRPALRMDGYSVHLTCVYLHKYEDAVSNAED